MGEGEWGPEIFQHDFKVLNCLPFPWPKTQQVINYNHPTKKKNRKEKGKT
jgi:hypothetical protein